MFTNNIKTMTINKNEDGTYKISGKVNDGGFVEIPRARINLQIDALKADDIMTTITFN